MTRVVQIQVSQTAKEHLPNGGAPEGDRHVDQTRGQDGTLDDGLTHERVKSISWELIHRLFVLADERAVYDLYTEDAVISGLIPTVDLTRDTLADAIKQINIFSKVHDFKLGPCFSDGTKTGFAHIIFEVTSHSHGATDTMDIGFFVEMQDDLIARQVCLVDYMAYAEKVGAMPQGALLLMLAGATLE